MTGDDRKPKVGDRIEIENQESKIENPTNGWRADLDLSFCKTGARTILASSRHKGPLLVQKPFYPEGPETCHTYIIHPPGGVCGGDELKIEVTAAAKSHVLLTTPAAGKFYRTSGPEAVQSSRLNVESGTVVEWLPQETIVYPHALSRIETTVFLEGDARFIGWEILCLGLPASERWFEAGRIVQKFQVWHAGAPLLIENAVMEGGSPLMKARWGLSGYPVSGTFVATLKDEEILDAVRQILPSETDTLFGATQINGLTVCRYLGWDACAALATFQQVWAVLRPVITGKAVSIPRIWRT